MKIIKAIARLLFIACIWSVGYAYWYRTLLMRLWQFDPIQIRHWTYVITLWRRGWVIRQPNEWAFVILLFSFIPLWFIGWALLSSVSWWKLTKFILLLPFRPFRRKQSDKKQTKKLKISKKKSYKKIRPPALRAASGKIKPIENNAPTKEHKAPPAPAQSAPAPKPAPALAPAPAPAPAPRSVVPPSSSSSAASSGGSVADVLRSAGYRLIQNVMIGSQKIDFIGVAADKILLCLVDAESGDWLADEERFNDEEPLWFSESNHRVSPVRLALNAKDALVSKLTAKIRDIKVEPMVVISKGTIINAEDMIDVWSNLHIAVCRYESGAPADIKSLPEVASSVSAANDALFNDVSSVVR